MEIVAQHLQQQALTRTVVSEKDIFGRSSFNRYYYAAFLEAKRLLSTLRPHEWGHMPHASMPSVLQNAVSNSLKKARQRAVKLGDTATAQSCVSGESAARDLAKILKQGYAVRVMADYHEDIPVEFRSSEYYLNEISISSAKQWPTKARLWATKILEAWRQADAG